VAVELQHHGWSAAYRETASEQPPAGPPTAWKPVCHSLGMTRSSPNRASGRRGVRWALLALGAGGLLYGAGSALRRGYLPVAVIGGGVVLVILGLGLIQRPTSVTWTRQKALA